MKKTDCYFYFELYDMGAHISCCTFKEYPLGKCPCDNCTNYVPQSKVSQIVREYLEHKAIPSAEPREVIYSGDGYADGEMVYDMANCPNCNYEFEESNFIWGCKFCPECGQALDWRLDNAEED